MIGRPFVELDQSWEISVAEYPNIDVWLCLGKAACSALELDKDYNQPDNLVEKLQSLGSNWYSLKTQIQHLPNLQHFMHSGFSPISTSII